MRDLKKPPIVWGIIVCSKGECSTWLMLWMFLYFTLKYYFKVPSFPKVLACLIEA